MLKVVLDNKGKATKGCGAAKKKKEATRYRIDASAFYFPLEFVSFFSVLTWYVVAQGTHVYEVNFCRKTCQLQGGDAISTRTRLRVNDIGRKENKWSRRAFFLPAIL